MLSMILLGVQLFAALVTGVYFFRQMRKEKRPEPQEKPARLREMEKLRRLRSVSLTTPFSEQVRPGKLADIVGQEEGIRALQAILCGANPQHVLIYGPPGVGKTCAARLTLQMAKKSPGTPFLPDAPFIEADATCMHYDERSIANPLVGSVHDPIYQGAGALGQQGVPQPKPGAVTKAHGGVLFLDEIGELHPAQMNKLLKVLEDRKVMFESAYYDPDDPNVPRYIREIFEQGLPADFRLVGATTRSPQDIPSALRSRCMEVFFRALTPSEKADIALGAAQRAGYELPKSAAETIGRYASCGRDAVNIVQMAAGLAQMEERKALTGADVAWVIRSGRYAPQTAAAPDLSDRVGCVHALAVQGNDQGAVMDVEAAVTPGTGQVHITGVIDTEELGQEGHRLRRKSTALCAAENVRTLLLSMGCSLAGQDVHLNFPGGAPVDGPSAGVAMLLAAVSALTGIPVDGKTAMTGEITVQGGVKAVGGVPAKIGAAKQAGLTRVLIPRDNIGEGEGVTGIEVIPVATVREALDAVLSQRRQEAQEAVSQGMQQDVPLAASGVASEPSI